MSYVVDPERPLPRGLAQTAAAELRAALDAARDTDRPAADRIHEARTHCKRVRALLRLVGSGFPAYREENAAIRDAARLLSGARDSTVMLHTLAGLTAAEGTEGAEAHGFAEVRGLLSEASSEATNEEGALRDFADAIEPLYKRALAWHAVELATKHVLKGAQRTYAQCVKGMRKALHSGEAEDFHAWRKQVKYHWYQLNLLRRFDPERFRARRAALKELARTLGEHHDIEVLHEHVRSRLAQGHRHGLGKLVGDRHEALVEHARDLAHWLFAAKSGEWRDHMQRLLTAPAAAAEPAPPADAP